MFRQMPLLPTLRYLMLGLLVLGLMAGPVLAAGCAIADAGHVLEGEAHAPGDADEWCCPEGDCLACCPLSASPFSSSGTSAATPGSSPPISPAAGFEPGGCSPPLRPPIAA